MYTQSMKPSSQNSLGEKNKHTQTLAPLQVFCVIVLILAFVGIGVNTIVTYGSDRLPSTDLFFNSQTVNIIHTI